MKSLNLFKLFLGIFFISLLSASCSDSDKSRLDYFGDIRIDKTAVKLNIEDKINLQLSFVSQVIDKNAIKWVSADPTIASVSVKPDKSCVVSGVSAGKTIIKVSVDNTDLYSECVVEVNDSKGVIRILAIGNSFSEDAIENYLYDLAAADGKTLVIGNMYIGGCSLATHLENANNNKSAYEYRKVGQDGVHTTQKNWSLSKAIADENWDYISFQEVSQNSGIYSNYEVSLPKLVNYTKGLATNADAKYILHQTWAYAKTTSHAGFVNYGKDQMKMYNAIVEAVSKAGDLVDIDIIVPAGTAIQNARTSVLGDNMNVGDGYHLEKNVGRFTAAATWYAALLGADVTKNRYKPASISRYYDEITKAAAHAAVQKPTEVTDLVDYKDEPTGPSDFVLQKPVYVCFNMSTKETVPSPYQNLGGPTSKSKLDNLTDADGQETDIILEVIEPMGGGNDLGAAVSEVDWVPNLVSKYAFFASGSDKVATFSISRLNPNQEYVFEFYGSRAGNTSPTDNRETAYILKGATENSVYLDALGNNSKTAVSAPIKSNSDGKITLDIKAGPNNNNGSKYIYINAMRIIPVK